MSRGLRLMLVAAAALSVAIVGNALAAPEKSVTKLVPMPKPATDLRPASDFAHIADRRARAVALFTEMGKVIQHPRCLNCHPRGDSPTQRDGVPHSPPVRRGAGIGAPGLECTTCHGAANVDFVNGERSIPGNPAWMLAPASMAWQGKSLGAICAQLKDPRRNGGKSLAELQHHNAEDGLVGWGWNPGKGRAPVPGTQKMFGDLTQAWIDAGAACPKR